MRIPSLSWILRTLNVFKWHVLQALFIAFFAALIPNHWLGCLAAIVLFEVADSYLHFGRLAKVASLRMLDNEKNFGTLAGVVVRITPVDALAWLSTKPSEQGRQVAASALVSIGHEFIPGLFTPLIRRASVCFRHTKRAGSVHLWLRRIQEHPVPSIRTATDRGCAKCGATPRGILLSGFWAQHASPLRGLSCG